jgi:hypothetical protein
VLVATLGIFAVIAVLPSLISGLTVWNAARLQEQQSSAEQAVCGVSTSEVAIRHGITTGDVAFIKDYCTWHVDSFDNLPFVEGFFYSTTFRDGTIGTLNGDGMKYDVRNANITRITDPMAVPMFVTDLCGQTLHDVDPDQAAQAAVGCPPDHLVIADPTRVKSWRSKDQNAPPHRVTYRSS